MGPLLNFYWKLVEKHLEPVESLKDRLAKALGEEHISDLHIFGDGRLLVTMIEKKRPGLIANMNSPDLCGDASEQERWEFLCFDIVSFSIGNAFWAAFAFCARSGPRLRRRKVLENLSCSDCRLLSCSNRCCSSSG